MTDLNDFARVSLADRGLCVLATGRADATIQASVINAGVLDHPRTGVPVVGLVCARAGQRKLQNFRRRPPRRSSRGRGGNGLRSKATSI